MRRLGTVLSIAAVALGVAACGDRPDAITAPDNARFDEAGGGGTYGSGGKNLIPAEPRSEEGDVGGTYGSGGKDGGGAYGSGGNSATADPSGAENEDGGGTYGSGGRADPPPATAPMQ